MGTAAPALSNAAAIGGTVHGGQSPLQNATVTLYVTSLAATGYGQAATAIGSAMTDVNGNFTISPSATPATCPAGQQAYITSAGGYPSGNPTLANNSILEMVALGDCANVSASTFVILNELTTVAAAYALSGFITTSASNSLFTANISAPSSNRAAAGSASAAAGLAHAFLNATNLVNPSTGQTPASTPPITIGTASVTGTIPAAEINTLGDIMQTCVNGATGNNQCNSLFGFTKSISGVVPTNTLQSMVYLARNPYPSAAAMDPSTGLFGLASSSPAFLPSLSATPPDWSLAIVYKGTPLVAPYDISLDANDTLFYGASGSANLVGLSAYGTVVPAFTAGTGSATRQLAPDGLGNVWVSNNASLVLQYSATGGGAPTPYAVNTAASGNEVFGVAVDAFHNVWLANAATTSPNVVELAYSSGLIPSSPTANATPTYTPSYSATVPSSFEPVELTIDASQNIWVAPYYTNASIAVVLPNLSAATPTAAPTYTTSGTTVTPLSATFNNSALKPLGIVIDASGNAWYGITGSNTVTTAGLEEVVPTRTNSVITAITPQTLIANATLGAKASQIPGIDGAGTIYLPDNQGAGALGIHMYSTTGVASTPGPISPPAGILGCAPTTTTPITCGTGSASAVYNPREIAIDSTGSVWAGITSGGVTQLIGLGAPTWPLLATGKPGLSPGLTAVAPLP